MKNLAYRREVALMHIPGTDFVSITTQDNPAAVEFDFHPAWEKFKALEEKPPCIFMFHTHPPGFDDMSSTDRNMVHGWNTAFGVPVAFLICQEGKLNAWIHDQGKSDFRGFLVSENDALVSMLQFLSVLPNPPTKTQINAAEEICRTYLGLLWKEFSTETASQKN